MDKVVDFHKDKNDAAQKEGGDQGEAPHKPKAPRRIGGRFRLLLGVVVVAFAGALAAPWLAERWTHVSINDSRIAGNLVTVSSEVSGRVTSVPVIAGDRVRKGQLLAGIDREQTLLELQALDAQIVGIEAQQSQLRTQQQMIRTQVAAKLAAGRTEIKAAEANHRSSEAVLQNARSRFERISSLVKSNVSSAQTLEEAQAALSTAEQQEQATAAGIETATANLVVIQSEEAQITVLDRQIATLDAQKTELVAEREQKRIDLARCEIRAEFDGVVDSTFVDAGEYVSPGTRLLIYHDPNTIWVDANVKETDFERVKIGAPAVVTVDAYPDMEFHGEVVRLGEAATSQFVLLPSPNPSGNFTKITQRLPIRISIEQRNGLLRPGMMVELSVHVVD